MKAAAGAAAQESGTAFREACAHPLAHARGEPQGLLLRECREHTRVHTAKAPFRAINEGLPIARHSWAQWRVA
eukprot:8653964-Alexandrium_andersonii.AAC.1